MGPTDPQPRQPLQRTPEDDEAARSRVLREHHLPVGGDFPFIPPKNWRAHQPLRKNRQGEYIDLKARRWRKGPTRTQTEAWEWDVQLTNGDHLNIDWEGNVTHPKPKGRPKTKPSHRGLGGKGKRKRDGPA